MLSSIFVRPEYALPFSSTNKFSRGRFSNLTVPFLEWVISFTMVSGGGLSRSHRPHVSMFLTAFLISLCQVLASDFFRRGIADDVKGYDIPILYEECHASFLKMVILLLYCL